MAPPPPAPPPLTLPLEPLTAAAFRPFGTVIEQPASSAAGTPANQGTATAYPAITPVQHKYESAPSARPAALATALFVCRPRALLPGPQWPFAPRLLPVPVLERHPFTTQTFVPLGAGRAGEDDEAATGAAYAVVVVAPTAESDGAPDVRRARAFRARADQGVTYGAGTWHAPMAVVGAPAVSFFVLQYKNGVAAEDCEELDVEGAGAVVDVGEGARRGAKL